MTRDDVVRAFVALEIPADARQRIVDRLQPLRPRLPGLRWTAPESLHLTLRFLGDTRPGQVEGLAGDLAAAAAGCPAGLARLPGLGLFPERGAPRILWLGFELPDAIYDLQRACERAARAAGFEPERRPFAPHLTLGRWRDRAPRPELPPCDLGELRLDRLVLFRSQLDPRGAVHTALRAFPLA
jgi:2'-5' RNA ligase